MPIASKLLSAAAVLAAAGAVSAFDMARDDNVVAYWGQNSHGASDPSDQAGYQKKLGDYCDDDTMDTFPISFLTVFFGTGGLPQLDLANICNANDGKVFPGSQLPDCSFLEADIKKCQDKGKIVTLSMGGATGGNAFVDDAAAAGFADQIWDLFLGGSSETRPFGAAQLDGVDLDIEGGSGAGYIAFVNKLQEHYKAADKKYYVTAAPQCPFPDAILGQVLDGAPVDAVYVQFYNNYCSVTNYADPNSWNYEAWDTWAQTKAPNKDVKIYIGAPGAPGGANPGSYVDAATLGKIATETRTKYPKNFGGVMYWDASQAVANSNFNKAIKDAIRNGDAPPPPPPTEPSTEAPPPPSSTEAPVPPTTEAPVPSTTVAPPPPTETPAPGGGGEGPAPTETEDPCPPEETAAPPTETAAPPPPTETEDPCPPEETPAPGGGGEVPPTPTETEDPCPPEETSAPPAPTETEDPCPPEETAAPPPPTETEDPCPPEDTPTPSAPAPTGNTSGGACGSAKAWAATEVFVGGDLASYNGKVYKAKWWTQAETPGSAEVWEAASCSAKRSNLTDPRVKRRALATPLAAKRFFVPHATPVARFNPHKRRI